MGESGWGGKELHVAVVGAGIAGLTVAATLARAGIGCRVFEQAPELAEVGAGIQISPNASRILHRLGLGPALDKVAMRPEALEMRRWNDDGVLMRNVLGADCEAMYGAPYYSVHRADLHQTLLDSHPPGLVQLDRTCIAVIDRPDGAEIEFADGSSVSADVVIGADGIHSVTREMIVKDDKRFSGQIMYRGLVPADRLPHLLDEPKVIIWMGPKQHTVCYPISAGKMISFAASTPVGDDEDWRTESWSAEGSVKDLLAAYEGWNPALREVLGAADAVLRWALHDRDPVDTWSGSRITLIGDAAHPMLPFGAQGANQAIEDAGALAVCLRGAVRSELTERLQRYEALRKERTAHVHKTMRENARNHHYDDGTQQAERDARMREKWGLRSQSWLFGYDAEEAATSS